MTAPLSSLRGVRIAFLTLLAVCVAQAAYWTIDQALYTSRMHDQRLAEHARDVRAALELEQRGATREEVLALYPELSYVDGAPVLSAGARAALDDARSSRLVRYGSEGAFFLLVLCGSIWVLARALRQDAALRRRQQSFLASASHEFKSPLASARLSIETLALRDPPKEQRDKLADRALDDLSRLDGLIVNLLDNAQLEEGRVRLVRERIDLGKAARATLAEFEGRVRANGVELEVRAEPGAECLADPVAVHSVLRNLVDNALKAVSATRAPRIELSVRAQGDDVVTTVRDNGVGFESSAAERLFDKFHREPGPRSGAGLGLYLVRRFVELQGGVARASSAGPGSGAQFEVAWPRAAREPAS
ncbi:MAG: HAMP domain-containing histidine kinase [Planctomycetota bacterium]|nr:MAG: HAMP domain-containing histidine kinase [Planctomycetota bacterium]